MPTEPAKAPVIVIPDFDPVAILQAIKDKGGSESGRPLLGMVSTEPPTSDSRIEAQYGCLRIQQQPALGTSNYAFFLRTEPGQRGHLVASFSMRRMHGCCGIIVSHDTKVNCAFRGKGIGQKLMQFKILIAQYLGYSNMLATVIINHGDSPIWGLNDANSGYAVKVQLHILEKFGWKQIHSFINRRTMNEVGIFSLDIVAS